MSIKAISYLLILLVSLQGTFAAWVQQGHLQLAKAFGGEDMTLICTGKEMKWVSISLSEELGRFVFVDSPEAGDASSLKLACENFSLFDNKADDSPLYLLACIHWQKFRTITRKLRLKPFLATAFEYALTRAPPPVSVN